MFGKNTKFEINTPHGWQDFHGVQKLSDKKVVDVVLDSGKQISVSIDHRFYERRLGYCDVSALYTGDSIRTKDGFETIIAIIPRYDNPDVYDAIEVGRNHCYYTNDIVSHNCEFLGSSNTLINGAKLASLVWKEPIRREENLDIFEEPQRKHTYVICVDVSEGQGLDYSAFNVFDVTEIPYRQVAKYRNDSITPLLFPTIIYATAKRFNEAFILVEINSIGLQVADILHFELGYENLLKFQQKGKQGTQASGGFAAGKNKLAYGLKITAQTKNIGCANLKTLIESDKLLLQDEDTITELYSFAVNKKSFSAEEGSHDDLAMTLVHFGWLTSQRLFKETVSNDIRATLQREQLELLDREFVPFGYISDGLENDYESDNTGELWVKDREMSYPFDDFSWLNNKL